MFRKDGKIRFHWRDPEYDDEINEKLDADEECMFVTPIAKNRVLRMTDPENFDDNGNGPIPWNVFIGSRTRLRREVCYGGLPSRCLGEDRQPEHYVNFDFFWFEGQIYLLRFVEATTALMKLTSENPEQDWQWLYETLVGKHNVETPDRVH